MKKFIFFLVQIFLGILIIYGAFLLLNSPLQWGSVWAYRALFFKGWLITIAISFLSLLCSFIFGFVSALLARSNIPLFQGISNCYVELIRGTPLLVQILFFYYVVAYNIGIENRYISGVIILSLFHGAYISEMIRGGVDTVSSTLQESARAIGLSSFQTYRYVIIPLAIKQVIPPLTGQFASIIKDSSLLSIIGINEVTNTAQQINSATYSTLESFLPLAFAYLILTLPISLWSKKMEKKFHYEA